MKRYRPLMLQKLDLRVPGIHVRQLAVHRHLPETSAVQPHSHKFAQCLVYLTGQGRQRIGQAIYPVQTGTALFVPPRVEHAFRREANRHPICLVLDFDWRGSPRRAARVVPLSLSLLREVRQQLVSISHLQRQSPPGPPLPMSALILRLLHLILGGLGLMEIRHLQPLSPISRKVDALLGSPETANLSAGKLARLAGYQHDHLNRLLKSHAGLTLGQFRARKLVARARQLLRQTHSVTAAASALGFSDPNYFARWFRRQTGMTPSQWRRNVSNDVQPALPL